ncbi:MAG: protein kinase [Deltaproteobacteria bacterium]|nr:protein kinase [Deltaproteobacteria bacterium]
MTVAYPDALFDRFRAGDVVLCAGVRFAATAGLPEWDALLRSLGGQLSATGDQLEQLLSAGNLLTAADLIKRKLGDAAFGDALKKAYGDKPEPAEAHAAIGSLPFASVISTGYDTLLDALFADQGKARSYSYADGAVLRLADEGEQLVLHAHGSLLAPERVVLTRLDYKRLIGPNQAYRAYVEDLYRSHTLLFVGYGVNDPDFQLFLDRLVATFRDAVSDHYAIMPAVGQAEADELYANYRIRVIPYDADDASAALVTALKQLADQWKEKGAGGAVEAADPVDWLRKQLAPVEVRIDVVAGEGLSLPEGRLAKIRDTAAGIQLSDLDPESLCRLGNVRLYLGDSRGATQAYSAALHKDADFAPAHLNLHHAMAEAKDYGKALEHLQRAGDIDETLRVVPKRFELRAVIGRGTTGTVYQAHDSEKKRDVIVKVLRASYVREHVSPEFWLQETSALTKLDHPKVAKVYQALLEGGRCLLVTENLSGHSLDRLLREQGPLSREKATGIMLQVCEALEYAHSQGVFHLDVMPSNIFLRDDGSVALMDFRTGRAQKGRTASIKKGSEGFQAPEILAGAGADQRADIYSLGATLYMMVTGKKPIGSFARLSEIAPAARRLETLVTRALRATPEERYSSVEEFAKALGHTGEDVVIPDSEDDLVGWLEVLSFQPENKQALDALGKLEQRFREQKDWDNLVTMLLGRVEIEPEREGRIKALREVARVFEFEVGDLSKAFAALSAAFREDHGATEVRRELERLAGATGMWNELVSEYSTVVQGLRDAKLACDWWVRIGHLYNSEIGHDDYAAAAFNQALSLDANRVDALMELAEVVRKKRDYSEYARLLKRQIDLEEHSARKVELLKDLARTYERELGSREQATLAYRQLLEVEPGNTGAMEALQQIYQASEMWEELATLLRSLISQLTEKGQSQDALPYRRTLAELLADRLGQPNEAIEHFEVLIEADADDVVALKGLERLYDAAGRNEEYLKVLDRRIDRAEDDDEKVGLYRRLAAEWEEQQGGKEHAASYLEKAIALKPSEDLYKSLIRLYWDLREHEKLAAAYQSQIDGGFAGPDSAGIYIALGRIYEEHLKDPDKAIAAYQALLRSDESNRLALAGLARSYEAVGSWVEAAGVLTRLAPLEDDVDAQVECYCRIGRIQLEQLSKPEDAEISLNKARGLRDDHTATLVLLAELHERAGDYAKAAKVYCEAAASTSNLLEKAERFGQAARIYDEQLGQPEQAEAVWAALLAVDPEHIEAAERSLALLKKRGELAEALPILEMLVRKADSKDRKRIHRLNLDLGDAYVASGGEGAAAKAATAYRAAYELDPTNPESLQKLAAQLYASEALEEAGKLYQAMLVHRRDSMEQSELVTVYGRLGEIKERLGDTPKAINMYEKAFDADPSNEPVLTQLVEAYRKKSDWEAVLRVKKAHLRALEGAERAKVLEEIGDLLAGELTRPKQALAFYREALEIDGASRRLLSKILFEVHLPQKSWTDAIDTIKKLEAIETDAGHSYRLHYTAAVIFRDQLRNPREAARHLDLALEADPTNKKAFEALDVLLRAQRNYQGLVKAYRRMLARLPETTPLDEQVRLWHELGRICEVELKDARGAIVAYEVAAKLDPASVERHETLAKLYASAGPDAYEKAILVNQRLLQNDPLRLDAYRELARIYRDKGETDRYWCVTAALNVVGAASQEEREFYEAHAGSDAPAPSQQLTTEIWKEMVAYSGQTADVLDVVFSAAAPVIVPLAARPKSAHEVRETRQLQPARDTRAYAQDFTAVCRTLGVHCENLYLRNEPNRRLGVAVARADSGVANILMIDPWMLDESRTRSERVFAYARFLAMLRPEYMALLATGSENVLRAVVLAALKTVEPSVRISGDTDEIEGLAEMFRRTLPPKSLEQISSRLNELRVAARNGAVENWTRGAELAANRAALVLCGDLATAARLVADDRLGEQRLDSKARLAALLSYAVSESYFKVRERLGVALTAA